MKPKGGMKKRDCVKGGDPSPRGVVEDSSVGSDLDNSDGGSSSSSSESSCGSEKMNKQTNNLQWKQMLDSVKKKSVRRFSVVPLLTTYEQIARKNLKKKIAKIRESFDFTMDMDCESMLVTKPSWRNFEYKELAAATDNFSSENLLGEGGHAQVYKGRLSDGQLVAVKKIMKKEMEEEDRVADFLAELGIIAHINHPNAAKLLGFSSQDGLHLVLEYLPNGSLARAIHGDKVRLDWKKRFKVAVGVAEGLRYLHHDCQRRIIHRDIKASNILLSEDYEAQISDFGLAKWLPENWVHHIVHPIEGTFGYLAPEYFMHGIVDEKTDVFAFGVLLLEILTGRNAVDEVTRQSLVMWSKPLLETNNAKQLCDPQIADEYDPTEMTHAMLAASLCISHLPTMRPDMNQILGILRGEEQLIKLTQKTNSGRGVIVDGCDLQDYTCPTYLDEINRHMQLVME